MMDAEKICREHHEAVKGTPVACDRIKAKEERKA